MCGEQGEVERFDRDTVRRKESDIYCIKKGERPKQESLCSTIWEQLFSHPVRRKSLTKKVTACSLLQEEQMCSSQRRGFPEGQILSNRILKGICDGQRERQV